MTEITFEDIGGEGAVYRFSDIHPTHVTGVPAKARSKFAEEYDVPYAQTRAQMTEYQGEKVVLVGEIDE